MVALKVRLLGGFELSGPSGTTLTVPTRKAKALLAMLAREPGEFQARETLAGTLCSRRRSHGAHACWIL